MGVVVNHPAIRQTAVPKFDDDVLLCPRCGERYLHHASVQVFDRGEDALTTRVTTVSAAVIVEDRESAGSLNPSKRRDGLTIDFRCEFCGYDTPVLHLHVVQHKGQTCMEWAWVDD